MPNPFTYIYIYIYIYIYKSWRQHPTRHQLYGHLPPITKTIQVRRTRHAGHCWRSRYEFISDVLLWTPKYGRAKAGRQARTYIQQLCEDTGCCPEDLPEEMNDREKWRERVRDIRATSTTWWWSYIYIYIYIYMICRRILCRYLYFKMISSSSLSCTQLDDSKYCCVTLMILIIHFLLTVKWFQVSLLPNCSL